MKTAIINYQGGNLASVFRALDDVGGNPFIAGRPEDLDMADRIVLPGVGAFPVAMGVLREQGWDQAIVEQTRNRGKPLIGVCLGMQLLASDGEEGVGGTGLGLIPGTVRHLRSLGCSLRIPHVGWNDVTYEQVSQLWMDVPDRSDFYFVHSYGFVPQESSHLLASTSYDVALAAIIGSGNIMGCQFHPEKSSWAGRGLLRNFVERGQC